MLECNKNKVRVSNYSCNVVTKTLEEKFARMYGDLTTDLSNVIPACSYSFTISNISRLMSTMIMELKDSYSEQSLRYCILGDGTMNMYKTSNIDSQTHDKLMEYLNKFANIYTEITQLKDEVVVTGRPKREDYKFNVLPEEARMILPVSICTNMMISLTGDALMSLYQLMNSNTMFNELKTEINDVIGDHSLYYDMVSKHTNLISSSKFFSRANIDSLFLFVNDDIETVLDIDDPIHRTASAIKVTSNTMYDTEKRVEREKEYKSVNAVVCNSQHTSVAEHTFITFKDSLSMVAYQQLIRHRHINVTRFAEYTNRHLNLLNFNNISEIDIYKFIPIDKNYTYDGMTLSELFVGYINALIQITTTHTLDLINEYSLNVFPVEFVLTSNLLAYSQVSAKRMCNCAQPEISNMFKRRFKELCEKDEYLEKLLYSIATPHCYSGTCTEGRMSCGKPMIKKDLQTIR